MGIDEKDVVVIIFVCEFFGDYNIGTEIYICVVCVFG